MEHVVSEVKKELGDLKQNVALVPKTTSGRVSERRGVCCHYENFTFGIFREKSRPSLAMSIQFSSVSLLFLFLQLGMLACNLC
jgi:hypothetical protein